MQTHPIAFSDRMDPSPARNLLRCFPCLMLLCLVVLARPAWSAVGARVRRSY